MIDMIILEKNEKRLIHGVKKSHYLKNYNYFYPYKPRL